MTRVNWLIRNHVIWVLDTELSTGCDEEPKHGLTKAILGWNVSIVCGQLIFSPFADLSNPPRVMLYFPCRLLKVLTAENANLLD